MMGQTDLPLIFDRFGNLYEWEDILAPPDTSNTQNLIPFGGPCSFVSGQNFDIQFFYEDANNVGFNDPVFGDSAKVVMCQVFEDISYLINATPNICDHPGAKPLLRIRLGSIQTGFAQASPFLYNHHNSSIEYPLTWKVINGGIDPLLFPHDFGSVSSFDTNIWWPTFNGVGFSPPLFHGFIEVNFNQNWVFNYNSSVNNTTQFDFYQAMLHEVLHLLGFASLIDIDGDSKVSGSNIYTIYDVFLAKNDTSLILNDTCHNVGFEPNFGPTDLVAACNISFKGTDDTLFVDSQVPYNDGRSLSHLDDQCYSNTTNFIMQPNLNLGTDGLPIRRPSQEEINILCDLGYEITGVFGDGSLAHHDSTYIPCGSISAGVDDFWGANCDTSYYISACDFPIDIDMNEMLANDKGVSSFDPNCVELITNNGLQITNVTYQYRYPGYFSIYKSKDISSSSLYSFKQQWRPGQYYQYPFFYLSMYGYLQQFSDCL